MINIKVVYPESKDFELFLRRYHATIQKSLYDSSVLVNKDVIAESRKTKTGRVYEITLPSGRRVRHIAANRFSDETSAQMTGKQNRARDFFIDNETAYIGVDASVDYAVKNEQVYGDLRKGLTRNFNKISDTFMVRLTNFFKDEE